MAVKLLDLDAYPREHTTGHSSKGDQPKWNIGDKWIKADYMGYESLSEVLVSRLLRQSSVSNYVIYEPLLIQYEGNTLRGCESLNFRKKNEQLVSFERLHRAYKGTGLAVTLAGLDSVQDRILYAVHFIESVTDLNRVGEYITTVLELDAFFLNEDRHTNNLAVIRNEDTLQYRFCPVFDNGLSLLADTNDYRPDADLYKSIERVRAKPFSMDFFEQTATAESLYGSPLKFRFTRKDVAHELEQLAGFYPQDILKRVETVVYEQMRKYPVYFDF